MKYSEFKRKLREFGFDIMEDGNVLIVRLNDVLIAKINKTMRYKLQTTSSFDFMLSDTANKYIWDCVSQLASTPLEEREEEKKYNVVACCEKYGTKGAIKERKMFYYRNEDGYLKTAVSDFNAGPDQQWTLQQIRDWGLESCERIEVKD